MPTFTRDPRTKEELLDRILRFDFEGDIRQIGAETARITRLGPNRLQLEFPKSGVTFELSIHRPREEGRPAPATPSERSFASTEPPGPPASSSDSATTRRDQGAEPEQRWEA